MFDFFKKKKKEPFRVHERFSLTSKLTGKEYVFFAATDENGKWHAVTEPKSIISISDSPEFCIIADDREDAELKGYMIMNMWIEKDDMDA